MIQKLSPSERDAALATLPDWRLNDAQDAIHRAFRFKDFSEAFGFMARVALLAEAKITTPSGRTSTTGWRSRSPPTTPRA
jgi:pterin-4a-carbinolamine dehydratase